MPVDVSPVASRRDLGEFIDLPYRLHATSPVWVPPLRLERRVHLNRRLNAFFRHGDAEYFLARRDGRVAGRITAHVNHAFNAEKANAWGWFGFLEFEDDAEVLAALLDAAAGWLAARGRDRMVGPADFTMNDECGILVEGFDKDPLIRQPWTPPYYMRRLEEARMTKAMDLLMWQLFIEERDKVMPLIWQMADDVEPKHGIVLRKMTRRSLRSDLEAFAEIYNEAWKRNWDFVPFDKHDLDAYAQELQLAFDKDWFMVAERKDTGEAVGVAMSPLDLNVVLKKMNGKILPFGWWHYLFGRKRIDRIRVGFLGVKPEYQHTGVAAKLYKEHFDASERSAAVKWGEMGWILETNRAMNRGMEAMGGTVAKKYRMYEREL